MYECGTPLQLTDGASGAYAVPPLALAINAPGKTAETAITVLSATAHYVGLAHCISSHDSDDTSNKRVHS